MKTTSILAALIICSAMLSVTMASADQNPPPQPTSESTCVYAGLNYSQGAFIALGLPQLSTTIHNDNTGFGRDNFSGTFLLKCSGKEPAWSLCQLDSHGACNAV